MGNSLVVVYDEILFCVYKFLKLEVFFFLLALRTMLVTKKKNCPC